MVAEQVAWDCGALAFFLAATSKCWRGDHLSDHAFYTFYFGVFWLLAVAHMGYRSVSSAPASHVMHADTGKGCGRSIIWRHVKHWICVLSGFWAFASSFIDIQCWLCAGCSMWGLLDSFFLPYVCHLSRVQGVTRAWSQLFIVVIDNPSSHAKYEFCSRGRR